MKIEMLLRRKEFEVAGLEVHCVDTEGERLIMIKLPLPEGLDPSEMMEYVQRQAGLIRECFKNDPMLLLVPMQPGDICEMGVVTPSLEDLKECIRALPDDQRQQLISDMVK